jgi:peptidoglycan/xylan/chitin deacetylase (PgdA/CDA1 family)
MIKPPRRACPFTSSTKNNPILAVLSVMIALAVAGTPSGWGEEMDLPSLEISGRGATLLFAGPNDRQEVALTFDDGPHPTKTALILDLLRENGVPATFFVLGEKVDRNPELVRRMLIEGHEVANHTYTHANLKKLGSSGVTNELKKTQKAIFEASGFTPTLFRPPYGATDLTTMAILANLNLTAVYWSVDTRDWEGRSVDRIVREVKENSGQGSIILFHDHGTHTLSSLPDVLRVVQEKGYRCVTISEMFDLRKPVLPVDLLAKADTPAPGESASAPETVFASQPLPQPQQGITPSDVEPAVASPPQPAQIAAPPQKLAAMSPSTVVEAPGSGIPVEVLETAPPEILEDSIGESSQVAVAEPLATETSTPSRVPTETSTASPTPSSTARATSTAAPTFTSTPSPTVTEPMVKPALEPTFTSTAPSTATGVPTGTATATSTGTATHTATSVPTATSTPVPPTATASPTKTRVPTATPTQVMVAGRDTEKVAQKAYRLQPVGRFSEKILSEESPVASEPRREVAPEALIHPTGYPGPWGYIDPGPAVVPPR